MKQFCTQSSHPRICYRCTQIIWRWCSVPFPPYAFYGVWLQLSLIPFRRQLLRTNSPARELHGPTGVRRDDRFTLTLPSTTAKALAPSLFCPTGKIVIFDLLQLCRTANERLSKYSTIYVASPDHTWRKDNLPATDRGASTHWTRPRRTNVSTKLELSTKTNCFLFGPGMNRAVGRLIN